MKKEQKPYALTECILHYIVLPPRSIPDTLMGPVKGMEKSPESLFFNKEIRALINERRSPVKNCVRDK